MDRASAKALKLKIFKDTPLPWFEVLALKAYVKGQEVPMSEMVDHV